MTRVTRTAADATAAGEVRPGRVLVLIGGLPGAGKTRLLSRLLAEPRAGVRGLDSEHVTERFRDAGVRLPYRLLRPAVHAEHRWTVRRVVRSTVPVVVVTDPLTSARRRAHLVEAGRRSGREVRVVLLDVEPGTALRGQRRRHRTLGARSMARHQRGWRALRGQVSGGLPGAAATLLVDRAEADRLSLDDVLG
jgi:predicted ATPase